MNKKNRKHQIRYFILIFVISKFQNIGYYNHLFILMGGGQHMERPNVERPIFLNPVISNIKIMKDEWFDFFIFGLIFLFFKIIWTLKIYDNLPNLKFFKFG